MSRSLILGLALALIVAAPAQAEFKGTPGKVAYIEGFDPTPLKIWDPAAEALDPGNPDAGVETIEDITWVLPTPGTDSLGLPSPPAWSPDGTRVAYVKSIPGSVNWPRPIYHTEIWIYDLRDGRSTQLTHPAEPFTDPDPAHEPVVGHTVTDWSPAWSPDGTEIVFIRQVVAFPDDDLASKKGQNLWTVPSDGGTESKVTGYGMELPYPQNNAVWIPGSNDILVSFLSSNGGTLVRHPVGAGAPQTISNAQLISDFDVSPDGKRFAMTQTTGTGIIGFSGDLASGAAVSEGAWDSTFVRYSNTGSGLLRSGCLPQRQNVCGLMERELEDEGADIEPGEDRMMLRWQDQFGVIGGPAVPGRSGFDVQAQTLPVIFLPGFLGSIMSCGSDELWPDLPFPELVRMSLQGDGLTNSPACPSAGPTGKVMETALGSDIYESVANHVREKYEDRGTLFGWDWRKRPQETFDRLEAAIDTALARDGPWQNQKAGRVTLWGHSYGGLLIRSYIDDEARAARVARVLTEGTPYWGSPKAIFPLAFGIESPLFSPMDAVIDNGNMQQLSRNLAGLYQLYPSDHHTGWLTIDGVGQGQAGVASFVTTLGGNAALFNQARDYHRDLYEGFFDFGGRIDVHALVGTGKETITSAAFTHKPDGSVVVRGFFGNGDTTVPSLSGAQGPPGAPLGDPVKVHYVCGIGHVPLPGNAGVIDAYKDFIDFGRSPRRLSREPCAAGGDSYWFDSDTIGTQTGKRAGGPVSLQLAQQEGTIDLIEAGPSTGVVTDMRNPVELAVPIQNGSFTYTPLTGDTQGVTRTFGPVSGELALAPGGAVTLDGAPLAPNPLPPGPPTPTPTPSPVPTPTPPPAAKKLRLVGKPKLKGRKLTLKVFVPGPGTLKAAVRKQGSKQLKPKAAGTRKLVVKLKKRVPKKLRLTVTFKPVTGAAQRVKRTIKRRARASSSRAQQAAAAPRPPG